VDGHGTTVACDQVVAPPWQFLLRAALVITGLVMLLFVDVQGAVFYVAWGLIVLALVSEAASTLVHVSRKRRGG